MAKPARLGHARFYLPAPGGSSWITVYRDQYRNEVGLTLSSNRGTVGEQAMVTVAEDWGTVQRELGGTASLTQKDGRPCISDFFSPGSLQQPDARQRALAWLAERVNTFVNVLRPRVRSIAGDLNEGAS